jgi:hydroxyacylglutathione hydrolase
MIFRRFYDENLAQASYMIACEKTREAIIVDPNVDIGMYARAAGADRVRIAHVTETHVHADFVSGAHALASTAGARLHLSGEGQNEWTYSAEALRKANVLHDGAEIEIGRVRLLARHTPGHTSEHMTFLVSDLERGDQPVGALTGDFIFVGDVGRPDLLERAAGEKGTMEGFARQLFRSLQNFKREPEHLQIWPGHGAGSACGKALGAMPQSTLGYEKLFNWALADLSEDDFVGRVLEDQPVPPRYFAVMKRVNRSASPQPRSSPARVLGFEDLEHAVASKAMVVDSRPAQKFAAGHIPGTINIPLSKSFLNWMGALVPEDRDFFVIAEADSDDAVKLLLNELYKIGLTRVRTVFHSDVIHEWKSRNGDLEKMAEIDPAALGTMARDNGVQIVDVRSPDEWSKGHLPGALHIPLAALPDRLGELNRSAPIVLHCKGGSRSSIATSFLQSQGMASVSNLVGGYEAWVQSGRATESPRAKGSAKSSRKKK